MRVKITYPVIRYNTIECTMTEDEKETYDNLNDEDKARFIKDKNDDQLLPDETSVWLIKTGFDYDSTTVKVIEEDEHPLHPPIAEEVPTTHNEHIECPNCNQRQDATIEHTVPWNTCIHTCEGCEYIIMESEWNQVPKVEEAEPEHPLHPPITKQPEQPHPLTGTYQFP